MHLPMDPLAAAIDAVVFVAVVFAVVRRPIFAVVALLLVEPFALYRYVGSTTITLPKVALLAAIIGLIVAVRADVRLLVAPLTRGAGAVVALGLALVLAANALSYLHASEHVPVLREVLKYVEYLAILLVSAAAYSLDRDDGMVRAALIVSVSVVSVLALSQIFTGATSFYPIGEKAIVRVAGPIEGPNQLSGYLGLALPFFIALACLDGLDIFVLIAVVLATLADVFTLSRAGLAASLVAVLLVFVLAPTRPRGLVIAMGAAICGAFAAIAALAAQTAESTASSTSIFSHSVAAISHVGSAEEIDRSGGVGKRSDLWRGAIALWKAHPIFGIGAGNYEDQIGKVINKPIVHTHANSWYLQALVEGGLPLLGATLFLAYASIAQFVRGARSHWLILGMLGASVGFALHQIVDYLIFYPKVATLWLLLLGVASVQAADASGEERLRRAHRGRTAVIARF